MFTSTRNYNNFSKFNYNPTFKQQNPVSEPQHSNNIETQNRKKTLIGLSLLGLAAVGGAIYINSVKGKSLEIEKILQQNPEIAKIYNEFDLKEYTIFKMHSPIDRLRLIFSSVKAGKQIEGLELPQVATFRKIKEDDLPKFSAIFADFLHIDNAQYVYEGDMKAFMDVLEEFNLRNAKTPSLVNIVNKEDFIEDFRQLKDKALKEKFLAFLSSMKEKQSVFITNDDELNKIFRQLGLKREKSDFYCTQVLKKDFEHFKDKREYEQIAKYAKLNSAYSSFGIKSGDKFAIAKLIKSGNDRNVLIDIKDETLRNGFIEELSKECRVYTLSGKSPKEIYKTAAELENRHIVRPDVPTFIYLKDFDKMTTSEAEKEYAGLFEELNIKYHTRFIIPSGNTTRNSSTIKLFDINTKTFEDADLSGLGEAETKKVENYLQFLRNKIKGFSYTVHGNANVIIQSDSKEKADSISKILKKAMDFKTIRITCSDDEEKTVNLLSNRLKEMEKFHQETGQYTIIELEDFDKYVSKNSEMPNLFLSKFIRSLEEANSKYHSIVFLKYNKPIDELKHEIASGNVFKTTINS